MHVTYWLVCFVTLVNWPPLHFVSSSATTHAVAVLRLDNTEVVPGVADRQRGARRVHRQGLGDPNRAPEGGAEEWPGSGTTKLLVSLSGFSYLKVYNGTSRYVCFPFETNGPL
jgi:hypothetical protein